MWDTAAVHSPAFDSQSALPVEVRGIPHLAKNERDMGHPWVYGYLKISGRGLLYQVE
jgi:hypothetical protein